MWSATRTHLGMVALVLVFVVGVGACASIMQGTTQSVGISSSPTGAEVEVNGVHQGETPLVADLNRKDHHIVRINLDGYEPYEATLTRGLSGWVVGNIVFGGVIGLAVDAISGGMYKLTPEQIDTALGAEEVNIAEEDGMFITVVLEPDPDWERVGSLVRE